ncbi:MAG: S-layer homology domain-containing protein, partial [Eubacteriales bacterium]
SAKGSVEVSIEKGSSGKRQNSGDSSTTTPVHPGAPTVTVKNEAAKELVKNITDQAQANHVDTLVGNAPMTEKKAALRGLSADTKAKLTAAILAKYTDVKPGEWYSQDLAMMLLAGLVKGTSETTISPQKQVTGEEMMTMLVRSMGKEPALIAGANWYAPYKAEAKALKLDEGIKFDVAKNMTRGEVATMMFTYVKLSEKSPVAIDANALANVKDAEAIPADYKEAVSYMYQKGLLKGYEDGSFKAGKDVSRIEAISILARLVAL